MKTTKIHTALSLALIFATTMFASAANTGKPTTISSLNSCIRYQVNVMIANEKELCNIYLIEIRNEHGALVAPAKPYVSGVTQYDFFERGPVTGTRVARLVRAEFGDRFVCEYELFAPKVILQGKFENGQTYRFDLIPSLVPPRD